MEVITIKELKEAIKDLPDNYEVFVPIWGNKTVPVEYVSEDHDKKRLNIMADVA